MNPDYFLSSTAIQNLRPPLLNLKPQTTNLKPFLVESRYPKSSPSSLQPQTPNLSSPPLFNLKPQTSNLLKGPPINSKNVAPQPEKITWSGRRWSRSDGVCRMSGRPDTAEPRKGWNMSSRRCNLRNSAHPLINPEGIEPEARRGAAPSGSGVAPFRGFHLPATHIIPLRGKGTSNLIFSAESAAFYSPGREPRVHGRKTI